jgi:hypothetical protein
MKNASKQKAGNNNAAATLANINDQIEALKQQRIGLAEPLKNRYAELRTELLDTETQIRELDPLWKSASLRVKADDKIREVIEANGGSMTEPEITAAIGDTFTKWKLRTTLKKRFAVDADGKYSVAKA